MDFSIALHRFQGTIAVGATAIDDGEIV